MCCPKMGCPKECTLYLACVLHLLKKGITLLGLGMRAVVLPMVGQVQFGSGSASFGIVWTRQPNQHTGLGDGSVRNGSVTIELVVTSQIWQSCPCDHDAMSFSCFLSLDAQSFTSGEPPYPAWLPVSALFSCLTLKHGCCTQFLQCSTSCWFSGP